MFRCIYVSMYLYSYPSTHDIWGLAVGGAWEKFVVHLKMMIEWTQRFTWSQWSNDFEGHDQVNWDALIEWVWRCTWRSWSCELDGHDWVNLEMHSKVLSKQVGRCNWRPWWSKIGGELGSSQWEVRQVLMGLYSSVSLLATVGMWQGDFTSNWCLLERRLVAVNVVARNAGNWG
jgi:hypothetical protein